MTTLVTVIEGKNESVDYVTFKIFTNKEEAVDFIIGTNANYSIEKKYWTYAEIVSNGERIELTRPEV